MDESPVVTGRLRALTMPEVTVELRPSGEPKATTGSPTLSRREAPSAAGGSAGGVLGVEHREVVDRAAADHRGVVAVAVLVDDLDLAVGLVGGLHDVVVGDDVALPVEHEAGAGRAAVLTLELGDDLHGAGQQLVGDPDDGPVAGRQRRRFSVSTPSRPSGDGAGPVGVHHAVEQRGAHRSADEPDHQREPGDGRPAASRGRGRAGRAVRLPGWPASGTAAAAGSRGGVPVARRGLVDRRQPGGSGGRTRRRWGGGGPDRLRGLGALVGALVVVAHRPILTHGW